MQNSGQRNRQGGDVGQCVEVCRAVSVTHPQAFLTCGFEAGIVTLALCTQGVCPLETEATAVNGKPVIVWNGLIFRAAPVFLAVIPVFVVAGTFAGFGLTERAAVFLPGTMIVGGFSVLVHSQSGLTDRIAGRKRFRGFRAAWIEGDKCLALIDRFHGVVDVFHVIALVGKEGAFFQRNRLITFHNDKRTDHGFFGEAPPPGCRSGQREVQAAEKLVVKRSAALGCEQRHILNDFLSVDSGQPLSGWFSLQANFTKKGLRFLYHTSDFRLKPWPGTIAITTLLEFCSWLIINMMNAPEKNIGIYKCHIILKKV